MIKQDIFDAVQGLSEKCSSISKQIWENPEVSGNEVNSANYVRKVLSDEGFKIEDSKYMQNAFYAEYGSGSPVIAILGEYDALPALSQKACSLEKEPIEENAPGHGCGHNLMAAASSVAAIVIKRFLESEDIQGTVRFYGCPEEELLSGKVKMIYNKEFEGVDLAISWHPMDVNMTHDGAYLANTSARFNFHGISSHAAFAPDRGRSALDAVELMSVGCNYLREHVPDMTRIHYSTDCFGVAPNIVPDKASALYYVRALKADDVKETMERVCQVAQGAALMTDTTVDIEKGIGCYEFNGNEAFGDLTFANMIEADGPKYTKEEIEFAKKLQSTLAPNIVEKSQKVYSKLGEAIHVGVADRKLWEKCRMSASSDSGDVSYYIPTNLFTTACMPIGCAPHTWQATSSTGSSIGEKGALYAAKIIAGTAYDLYTQPEVVKKIKHEFDENSDGTYKPMYDGK